MKFLTLFMLLFINVFYSFSQVHVSGYYRKNGTYVQPHYRSSPDGNPYNNYSYPGNYNPYTGRFAKGDPSTYLNRYYNVYPYYSTAAYGFYINNLCETDYSGLEDGHTYIIHDGFNNITGYITPAEGGYFDINDTARIKIGYVKLSNNKKRFTVYSLDGYKIASNKKNIGWTIGYFAIGAGIGLLLGLTATAE